MFFFPTTFDLIFFFYSDLQSQSTSKKAESGVSWLLFEGEEENKQLTCCADCSAKFEAEARSLQSSSCNSDSTTSSLPAWLQQYKNEKKATLSNNDKVIIINHHLLHSIYF